MAKQLDELKEFMENLGRSLKADIVGLESNFTTQIESLKVEISCKSEYVEQKLGEKIDGIKSELVDEIKEVRTLTEQLSGRIEEVNSSHTKNLTAIETAIQADLAKVKDTNRFLAEDVNLYKTATNQRIEVLSETSSAHQLLYEGLVVAHNKNQTEIQTLKQKLINLEKSSHGGLQHTRGWNIEIDGIPPAVGDERSDLETAVIALMHGIGVELTERDIEACHRLPSKTEAKATIVRFHSRKIVHIIHDNKNKLKNLGALGINITGLDAESRIFIRASQCPYQKNLSYNCRQLKRANLIAQTTIGKDGKTKIKTLDNRWVKILHETELSAQFPDFEFTFNVAQYGYDP